MTATRRSRKPTQGRELLLRHAGKSNRFRLTEVGRTHVASWLRKDDNYIAAPTPDADLGGAALSDCAMPLARDGLRG